MDGGNGWHVCSCHGGGHDKTIINRMMLRFRPIAPKPAAGSSFPGGNTPENKNGLLTGKRAKRKYVRVKNNPRRKNCSTSSSGSTRSSTCLARHEQKVGFESPTVTLQLMPENTDGQGFPESGSRVYNLDRTAVKDNNGHANSITRDYVASVRHRTEVVESWVTVEFVTDNCMGVGAGGLGCTDLERMSNLDKDTCPGFISDGSDSVRWVNEAYKNMVKQQPAGKDRWLPETVAVWLIIAKAKLPNTAAFTCLVSLRYYSLGKEKCLKMVPCDVWRMDWGGFAWRLDVKAALSLGL